MGDKRHISIHVEGSREVRIDGNNFPAEGDVDLRVKDVDSFRFAGNAVGTRVQRFFRWVLKHIVVVILTVAAGLIVLYVGFRTGWAS